MWVIAYAVILTSSLRNIFMNNNIFFQQKDSFFRSLVEASKNSAEIFAALNAKPENNPTVHEIVDDDVENERQEINKSVTAFWILDVIVLWITPCDRLWSCKRDQTVQDKTASE